MKYISNNKRIVASVTLALGALLISGCMMKWKAYPGPELPKEKIATIETNKLLPFSAISITKVDGKNPPKMRVEDTIEVLPGEHTVLVLLMHIPSGTGFLAPKYEKNLTFVAEAGHVYIVGAKKEFFLPGRRWFWIEDEETKEIVAGEKPEE